MNNSYKISKIIIDTEINDCADIKNISKELEGNSSKIKETLIETLIYSISSSISYDSDEQTLINRVENFKYNRSKYENKYEMNKFKDVKFKQSKTIENNYKLGEKLLKTQKESKEKYGKNWTKHSAETDHIIPLKNIFNDLNKNTALTENDIKEICNIEKNFALIDKNLNCSKSDNLNSEYLKNNTYIDKKSKKNMIQKEKNAQKEINKITNKTVVDNMLNDTTIRSSVNKNMTTTFKNTSKNLFKNLVKDIIIEFSSAIIYEFKDLIYSINDFEIVHTIKRISRHMWDYIKSEKFKGVLKNSVVDLLKALIDTLISYFTRGIKMIWKIIRTSIKEIMHAVKFLIKPDKNITKSEAKDLALKMLSVAVINVLGVYLNTLLSKIPFLDNLSNILSGVFVGLISTLVVLMLDKIDLFSAKTEKVNKRIDEIYISRKNQINGELLHLKEKDQMRQYQFKLTTNWITNEIVNSISSKNYDQLNNAIIELGNLFDVKLKYQSKDEFVRYIRVSNVLLLD